MSDSAPYEDFRGSLPATGLAGQSLSVPHWGDAPDAWDVPTLAGKALPGICTVKGTVGSRVDRKTIPGTNGQTFTHIGYEPADVEITCRVWMPAHLDTLKDIVALVRPKRAAPQPVDVHHPALALMSIGHALVLKISLPERDESNDTYVIRFTLREFTPTGQGKKGNVGTAKNPHDITSFGRGAVGEKVDAQIKAQQKPSKKNLGPTQTLPAWWPPA